MLRQRLASSTTIQWFSTCFWTDPTYITPQPASCLRSIYGLSVKNQSLDGGWEDDVPFKLGDFKVTHAKLPGSNNSWKMKMLHYVAVLLPKKLTWNLNITPKWEGKSSEPSLHFLGVPSVCFRRVHAWKMPSIWAIWPIKLDLQSIGIFTKKPWTCERSKQKKQHL